MKKRSLFLCFALFFALNLYAEGDSDIDGVSDAIDQCPDTSFDELVNHQGCSKTQRQSRGVLSLKVGSDFYFEKVSDAVSSLNFQAVYTKNPYFFSLSNQSYLASSVNTKTQTGDFYPSGGYTFDLPKSALSLSLGAKLSSGDAEVSTGENDYFAAAHYDYFMDEKSNLFLHYGYTFSGDSQTIDYEDFHFYALGAGYALHPKWYSALSYDYSGSNIPESDAYQTLSWFNSFDITKNVFIIFGYAHGLGDDTYSHALSLKLGVEF